MKTHWLYRPENRPRLWKWGGGVLALTVIYEILAPFHGHFAFDSWFLFHALYGLGTCVAMIVFAKLLGVFVKRRDTYYDD